MSDSKISPAGASQGPADQLDHTQKGSFGSRSVTVLAGSVSAPNYTILERLRSFINNYPIAAALIGICTIPVSIPLAIALAATRVKTTRVDLGDHQSAVVSHKTLSYSDGATGEFATSAGNNKYINQDAFTVGVLDLKSRKIEFTLVADGHGEQGQKPSSYVADHFPSRFEKAFNESDHEELSEEAARELSAPILKQLHEEIQAQEQSYGTTFAFNFFIPQESGTQVISCFVGDSRTDVLRADGSAQSYSGTSVEELCKKQYPDHHRALLGVTNAALIAERARQRALEKVYEYNQNPNDYDQAGLPELLKTLLEGTDRNQTNFVESLLAKLTQAQSLSEQDIQGLKDLQIRSLQGVTCSFRSNVIHLRIGEQPDRFKRTVVLGDAAPITVDFRRDEAQTLDIGRYGHEQVKVESFILQHGDRLLTASDFLTDRITLATIDALIYEELERMNLHRDYEEDSLSLSKPVKGSENREIEVEFEPSPYIGKKIKLKYLFEMKGSGKFSLKHFEVIELTTKNGELIGAGDAVKMYLFSLATEEQKMQAHQKVLQEAARGVTEFVVESVEDRRQRDNMVVVSYQPKT